MARKKIEPPYEGLGRDPENKLMVQKSLPLFALWRSDFTLAEFKILDMYLARINSRNPSKRSYTFTKGELETALGLKKINISVLKERVKRLMQPLFIQTDKYSFKGVALFEEADCRQDPETGLWTVTLECTQKAMKYFFGIEELGYLRYKLRSIVNLKSRYSYILFIYLEHNRFRKEWEVSLDELKQLLKCDGEETYTAYKRFNDLILKKCQKELHENSELRFSYEAVKKGKSVVAVRFAVETLSDETLGIETDPNQVTVESYLAGLASDASTEAVPASSRIDDLFELLSEACNGEFAREDIVVIHDTMNELNIFPWSSEGDLQRVDFLQHKYNRLEQEAAKKERMGEKPIAHRLNYLLALIRKGK